MVLREVRFLGEQQMIEQAIGFVGGVQSRQHVTLGDAAISTLVSSGDRGTMVSQTTSDAREGIAESGIATFGNLAEALRIATLDQNGVKARERPDVIGGGKTSGIPDPGQIAGGMIRAHAGHGHQDARRRGGHELMQSPGLARLLEGRPGALIEAQRGIAIWSIVPELQRRAALPTDPLGSETG